MDGAISIASNIPSAPLEGGPHGYIDEKRRRTKSLPESQKNRSNPRMDCQPLSRRERSFISLHRIRCDGRATARGKFNNADPHDLPG